MNDVRILIVEDDPIIAADIADRLREFGHEPLPSLSSGEAAIEFLDNHPPPDILLLDIQLEGPLDGIETAARALQKHPRLPHIFLTSNSDEATFARAKAVRPAAFLSKPFRGRDLRHAIELAIGHAADQQARPAEEEASFLFDDRLFVKVKDRMVRVFFDDIRWAEAEDYYCKIATPERELLLGQTLGKLGEVLERLPGFVRVHRSFIVNLRHVEQIGEAHLHIGQKVVPISRQARAELLARLQRV